MPSDHARIRQGFDPIGRRRPARQYTCSHDLQTMHHHLIMTELNCDNKKFDLIINVLAPNY